MREGGSHLVSSPRVLQAKRTNGRAPAAPAAAVLVVMVCLPRVPLISPSVRPSVCVLFCLTSSFPPPFLPLSFLFCLQFLLACLLACFRPPSLADTGGARELRVKNDSESGSEGLRAVRLSCLPVPLIGLFANVPVMAIRPFPISSPKVFVTICLLPLQRHDFLMPFSAPRCHFYPVFFPTLPERRRVHQQSEESEGKRGSR